MLFVKDMDIIPTDFLLRIERISGIGREYVKLHTFGDAAIRLWMVVV